MRMMVATVGMTKRNKGNFRRLGWVRPCVQFNIRGRAEGDRAKSKLLPSITNSTKFYEQKKKREYGSCTSLGGTGNGN